MKSLILIRGLQGSGKTEFAGLFEGGEMFAADDWMVDGAGCYQFDRSKLSECHQRCEKSVEIAMITGKTPIRVHNTFAQAWEMERYFELAEKYGYRVYSVIVENRHGGQSIHDVDPKKIERKAKQFDIALIDSDVDVKDKLRQVLGSLRVTNQRQDYHPEINVYTHTALVVGQALKDGMDILAWVGLFHDMGKIDTTFWNDEKQTIASYGHEAASARYIKLFADLVPKNISIENVAWIVGNHMRAQRITEMKTEKAQELLTNSCWKDLEQFMGYDDMRKLFLSSTEDERAELMDLFEKFVGGLIG